MACIDAFLGYLFINILYNVLYIFARLLDVNDGICPAITLLSYIKTPIFYKIIIFSVSTLSLPPLKKSTTFLVFF
jgi:hypothetical protein